MENFVELILDIHGFQNVKKNEFSITENLFSTVSTSALWISFKKIKILTAGNYNLCHTVDSTLAAEVSADSTLAD